mmetsp:Transcript_22130/g.87794  ORF Transcript_22130/g.87794 Transcript_22130/m.87794 type:complete len:120 (-) Transcript_22130:826-1185(-)
MPQGQTTGSYVHNSAPAVVRSFSAPTTMRELLHRCGDMRTSSLRLVIPKKSKSVITPQDDEPWRADIGVRGHTKKAETSLSGGGGVYNKEGTAATAHLPRHSSRQRRRPIYGTATTLLA